MSATAENKRAKARARARQARARAMASAPQPSGFAPGRGAIPQGFNRGVAGTLDTFLGNPAAALIPGLDSQPFRRGMEATNMITPMPEGPANQFIGRMSEEVGAAAVPAGGLLGLAPRAARAAGGLLGRIAQAPGRFAAAELGSAAAGGTGAAVAQQIAPDSPGAELVGQIAGAAAPSAAAGILRGAMRGGPSSRRAMQDTIETFNRAGTTPTVGQATGNTGTQVVEGVTRAAPGSTHIMADVAERQAKDLGATADDVVRRMAGDVSEERAGQSIERGFREFTKSKQLRGSGLWGKVDDLIEPETQVTMSATRELLAEMTGKSELSSLLTTPKIQQVAAKLEDVASVSYQDLRDLRSVVGRRLGAVDLIADIPRADLKRLYGALTDDIRTTASNVAGDAGLRAFDRASRFTRGLHGRVDDVLEPILRRTSPEKIFNAVRGRGSAHRGDVSTLRKVKRSLTPTHWRTVVGTVVQDLGTARASAQDATGSVFSPETFLTEWNKLKPAVRKLLFGGLGSYEKDLEAIAKSAARIRSNAAVLANPSGTARTATNIGAGMTGVGAMMSGDLAIPAMVGSAAGAANLTARLFSSPKFVRWLAKSTDLPADRLPGLAARLTQTVANEPEDVQIAVAQYLDRLKIR